MRLYREYLICLFILLLSLSVRAERRGGMLFRSYDVPAEKRTSLVIPSQEGASLSFRDSAGICFSLRFELNKGRFGYVCRLHVDQDMSLDFILSPHEGTPALCAVVNHNHLVPVMGHDGESLEAWNDLDVSVHADGQDMTVSVGGQVIYRVACSPGRHKMRICFGKNDEEGSVTTDIAPVVLSDLSVRLDRKKAFWTLQDLDCIKTVNGVGIRAENPFFLQDLRRGWMEVWSSHMPSVTYPCVSSDASSFFFISDGTVTQNHFASASSSSSRYDSDMKFSLVTDDFICLPDGGLVYADFENAGFIHYDETAHDWESANSRTRKSVFLKHNTVYLEETGEFVQLFGYGQHRYSSAFYAWNPESGTFRSDTVRTLAPRYMAAAADRDGMIYVLGGKGNTSGKQELGAVLFDDLSVIDPVTLESETLWHNDLLQKYVPASDIVFEEGSDSFLVLLYDPNRSDSGLQLTRFSLTDGSCESLCKPIPYDFSDITSDARLCYNREYGLYAAVVCCQDGASGYRASIYLLGNPIETVFGSEDRQGTPMLFFYIILSGVIAAAAAGLYITGRRKAVAAEPEDPDEKASGDTSMVLETVRSPYLIHLLGGFRVSDAHGTDITSSFSPMLIQLFTILVLHTAERGGISNAMLKSLLWPDKSDDKFNNNKGVNIRKLRSLLASVGDISIVSDGGSWKISDPSGLCDFAAARESLLSGDSDAVLRASSLGPLLPEYQFEWIDPFKTSYSELVFKSLGAALTDNTSDAFALSAADCMLSFDSLDEDAMLLKCRSLVGLGKTSKAMSCFSSFCEEYEKVMGEPFNRDFKDFTQNR